MRKKVVSIGHFSPSFCLQSLQIFFLFLLGHFGSVWVILGQFGSFWVILGQFGSYWVILGHFGSFWSSWSRTRLIGVGLVFRETPIFLGFLRDSFSVDLAISVYMYVSCMYGGLPRQCTDAYRTLRVLYIL